MGRVIPLAFFGRLQVVEPQPVAGLFVELAVQLPAVRAPVVLADKTLGPHRVADDAGFLDQDLLLEAVAHLLPSARLDFVVERGHAAGMRVAPQPGDLAPTLPLSVVDGLCLRRLPARA